MIAYKAVSVRTNPRSGRSEWQSATAGPCAVRYQIGRTTKPKTGGGPLCAFASEQAAKGFARGSIVLKCQVWPSKRTKIWETFCFRPLKAKRVRSLMLTLLPDGTILCTKIRPLEVVK